MTILDFRLHVFYTVAKRLNFTKAATDLFITQPAVTKHIQELESQFGTALFDRRGSKVSLTPAGQVLYGHAESIMAIYRQIEFDINALSQQLGGGLRLGASSTIAQYLIPPVLARFGQRTPEVSLSLVSGNTEQIEQALLQNDIDLGLVEGRTHHSDIRYTPFVKDELVLVCRADHPLADRDEISLDELRTIPLVLRERGSGSLEIVEYALRKAGLKESDLTVSMHLGSTEGIKAYLSSSSSMAFVSIFALSDELRNGSLRVLDVADLSIQRDFYAIQLQGISEGLADVFMRFVRQHHNRR